MLNYSENNNDKLHKNTDNSICKLKWSSTVEEQW